MKKNLYLMVGVPGSGKSTYLNDIANPAEDIIISRDEVRYRYVAENEPYFSKENFVFRVFINEIQKAIDDPNGPENIYCDTTHVTESSRAKVLRSLNLSNVASITALVMTTSLDDCLERNSHREGRIHVPESMIKKMWMNFESPENDKIFHMDVIYVD